MKRTLSLFFTTIALLILPACSDPGGGDPSTDSQTHWLAECQDDSACPQGLACLCGICAISCSDTTACSSAPGAALCVDTDANDSIQSACRFEPIAEGGVCLPACQADGDCEHGTCQSGACIPDAPSWMPQDMGDSDMADDMSGTCQCEEIAGVECCDGMCVNTFTDSSHCGRCDNLCTEGVCQGGLCETTDVMDQGTPDDFGTPDMTTTDMGTPDMDEPLDIGITSFDCGESSCDLDTQYCMQTLPGVVPGDDMGSGITSECKNLPDTCTSLPTCTCVMMNAPDLMGLGAAADCTGDASTGLKVSLALP